MVCAYANRLRHIPKVVKKAGEPSDGVISDSLRAFERISDADSRRNAQTGKVERPFKVQLLRKKSSK